MSTAHRLNPFNSPSWEGKVAAIVVNATAEQKLHALDGPAVVCKNPIKGMTAEDAGFLKRGESSVFHLPHKDPDYECVPHCPRGKIRTALQHDGPKHLGLWLIRCDEVSAEELSKHGPEYFYYEYVAKHKPVIM